MTIAVSELGLERCVGGGVEVFVEVGLKRSAGSCSCRALCRGRLITISQVTSCSAGEVPPRRRLTQGSLRACALLGFSLTGSPCPLTSPSPSRFFAHVRAEAAGLAERRSPAASPSAGCFPSVGPSVALEIPLGFRSASSVDPNARSKGRVGLGLQGELGVHLMHAAFGRCQHFLLCVATGRFAKRRRPRRGGMRSRHHFKSPTRRLCQPTCDRRAATAPKSSIGVPQATVKRRHARLGGRSTSDGHSAPAATPYRDGRCELGAGCKRSSCLARIGSHCHRAGISYQVAFWTGQGICNRVER